MSISILTFELLLNHHSMNPRNHNGGTRGWRDALKLHPASTLAVKQSDDKLVITISCAMHYFWSCAYVSRVHLDVLHSFWWRYLQ